MIRKFLSATAVAALMAGAASAATNLSAGSVTGTPVEIEGPVSLAQEALLATNASRTANFGLRISTAGIIPPGQNVFVTLTVTGGVWGSTLTGAEVVKGTTGAVVTSQSASYVRYLLTTDTGATTPTGAAVTGQVDYIELNMPARINGCNTLSFAVTEFITESGGTPIENTGVPETTAAPSVTCVNAISASLFPDVTPVTANDTALNVTAIPAFSDFVVNTDTPVADSADNAVVGFYTMTINTLALTRLDTLDTIGVSDVTGFTTTASIPSITGISTCDVDAVAGTFFNNAVAGTVASAACTVSATTPATLTTETGTFELNLGTGSVVAQTLTISAASLTLAGSSANIVTSDAFVGATDIENLVYNGQTFGPFDWVGDVTRGTNNVFRITGFGTATGIPGQLVIQNSSAGVNGTYTFTVPSTTVPVTNGQAVISAATITSIVGSNHGIGDVTFIFSTGQDLDVDRLLATAAGATVVSSFGDKANSDGTGTLAPLTSAGSAVNDDVGNN